MKKRILSIVLAMCLVLTLVPTTAFADTTSCEHSYEWQNNNGQYWQKCKYCNVETAKKDIPTFTIDAPDKVCRTQDCAASVIIPDGITDASLSFEFIGLGGAIDTTVEDGKLYGVVTANGYVKAENSFNFVVYATTDDGFLFTVSKTVEIQNEHATKTTTTKATTSKDGKIVKTCTVCGKTVSTTVIEKASSIKLSTTTYTYDGKVKKPGVKVTDSKGKTISSSNYTVTYAGGLKNVGKYAVKVTLKGNYSGTKTLYFTIKPKATSISSLSASSKKFTVKWKKQSTQVTGYQIQYSTSSKFTSPKYVTVSNYKTTSKAISKLKSKKKYYVRIRTYKTVNGTKYFSSWSSAKSVTTKK